MPSVALPLERYEQLQNLAEALGCGLADAIGTMLDSAAHAGIIPRQIPGLTVERDKDGRIVIDLGSGRRLLPADAARRYAKHVLGAARLLPPDAAERYVRSVLGPGVRVLADSGLGAVPRGAGVKLIDANAGAQKVVAPSVAGVFARQILEAAKSE